MWVQKNAMVSCWEHRKQLSAGPLSSDMIHLHGEDTTVMKYRRTEGQHRPTDISLCHNTAPCKSEVMHIVVMCIRPNSLISLFYHSSLTATQEESMKKRKMDDYFLHPEERAAFFTLLGKTECTFQGCQPDTMDTFTKDWYFICQT